jgi:hypothetical protein
LVGGFNIRVWFINRIYGVAFAFLLSGY